jgi:hypothetical protein
MPKSRRLTTRIAKCIGNSVPHRNSWVESTGRGMLDSCKRTPFRTLRRWSCDTTIDSERRDGMQVKTILNRIQRHRSFVYGPARLVQGRQLALEAEVRPRANARAKCSGCGNTAPGYDTLPARRFEFVPLWGVAVFRVYAMRRVLCPGCGVRVETVPWASGKHQSRVTHRFC